MRVLGMMSGTSHDGIDLAVVDFSEQDRVLSATIVDTGVVSYDPDLRTRLVAALPPHQTTLAEVCELDTAIGQGFAAAAAEMTDRWVVDAICSHGQTVFHWVDGTQALGTLQIGQPAWIAERTGCPVVADIRIRDIAAGGQGAPLASFIDYLLLSHQTETLATGESGLSHGTAAALNLGGISNITVIHHDNVVAFDIGPANALIDAIVMDRSLTAVGYDADASIARQGKVDTNLLSQFLADPYYSLPTPKSTGKEHFNLEYVNTQLASWGKHILDEDLLATLVELTVRTVADQMRKAHVTYCVVSGGGAHNPLMMERLREELPGVDIVTSDHIGMDADFKEAILMALIGWCTLHSVSAIVPGATGSRTSRVLGSITPGNSPLRLPAPVAAISSLRLVAPSFLVRSATLADLDQILEVFLACWRESYRTVLPESVVAKMTDEKARSLWTQVMGDNPLSVIVAVRDGRVLGLVRFGVEDGEAMIYSLYVSPCAQGLGVGTALEDRALCRLRRLGMSRVRLWVFGSNQTAIGFYRVHGWRPDSRTRVEEDYGEPEVGMWKAVP